ncbi:polysaccharide deacetylase family protein [Streptomyces scopuliridis]|uniref:Polysaccharide deacetylase family protein n=1 Tax=Streptomyces scopuliridis TaxID=452529 RepID=A0ACD4ZE75_9ACTN|nr:polysaccharide deacetylase family protein [Streptomyces scopuliridis]WSB32042.1 polysaccharide deacetylase family protein [Streptomyces scopuliridis]WSB96303.1 polysaccharide deacetylase family protein [Streptomyces scopuliridis]WSC09992.1 polysaccharide deacetylase family protein [Streptomyces scopuliridis]
MPKNTSSLGLRAAGALAAVASLALVLSGCSAYDANSPADARGDAKNGAKVAAGAVDCAKERCIALTFDAGPSEHTPGLLDILKKEKVPATFFLLGKNHVVKHPDLVRRIAAEGHEVANHTWSHKILSDQDPDSVRQELARTQDAIAEITGHKPTLMRPPQGRTDDEVAKVSRELGLAQIMWSATAKDYSTTDSELIKKRILDQADRDGIILLHDIYDGTVPAVPGIIEELKKRGYTFVTVPQLLAPGHAEPGKVYKP